MTKPIRLGIWGCGGHGWDGHGIVAKDMPEYKLAALCDISQTNMLKIREQLSHGILCGNLPREILCEVDAILIATPDKHHVEHLKMAIDHGVHVLIEKPIAITTEEMDEFERLLKVAERKKLVITSCHPRRFDPPFLWLKDMLPEFISELGPVVSFHYDFTYHKPSAAWKSSRSLLLDHHGHEIDLLSFLFGRKPFGAQLHDDSFDRYLVTGLRSDAISFSFHGTRRLNERYFHEWMTLRHTCGTVMVETHSGKATARRNDSTEIKHYACGATNYAVRSHGVMQNFADAINGTGENYLDIEDLVINNRSGVELLEKHTFYSK